MNEEIIECPDCHSNQLNKDGQRNGKQRYKCKDCGRKFVFGIYIKSDNSSKITSKGKNKEKSKRIKKKNIDFDFSNINLEQPNVVQENIKYIVTLPLEINQMVEEDKLTKSFDILKYQK